MGIADELGVCDLDQIWSACKKDDGSCLDKISEFLKSRCFLIIRQIVNMSSNAILNIDGSRGHKHSFIKNLYAYVLVIVVNLIVDITRNFDEIINLL